MKVISFSLWGTDPHFHEGAIENAKLAKIYYPGWQPVFFLRSDVPIKLAAALEDLGARAEWKFQSKGLWEGLFWRFEPIFDPFVTCTISRDCDSRLNPREAVAVEEWLASGHFFHSMRDHFQHNLPIMGGMFGCKKWLKFEEYLKDWTKYGAKGDDQLFLNEVIWPKIKDSTLAHDRYHLGLTMPLGGGQTYEYKPLEQLGVHDLRGFPIHDIYDTKALGEHIGARVGIPE